MVGAVEDLSSIKYGKVAVAIFVKLLVSFVDPGLAGLVGLASDGEEELVQVHVAVLISVQELKEDLCLALGDLDTIVFKAKVKLLFVKLARAVIIDVLEYLGDASQLPHTSRL